MPSPIVLIEDPDKNLYRYDLYTPTTLIGRDPSCDIVLYDITVSRQHLEIRRENQIIKAYALNQNNPIIIISNSENIEILAAQTESNERVASTELQDTDVIKVGKYNLHFILPDDSPDVVTFRNEAVSGIPLYLPEKRAQKEARTCSLSPQETRQLLHEERIISNAKIEEDGHSWTPGIKGLTFGKKGTIPIKSFLSSSIVAEIVWNNGVHCLIPKGGWLSIRLNQRKLMASAELQDEDNIQIGKQFFVYRIGRGI